MVRSTLAARWRAWLGWRRWLWLAMLIAGPAAGAPSSLVSVAGLEGIRVAVAVWVDESRLASLAEASRDARFKPLAGSLNEPASTAPIWLRIDLEVPAALAGQTAWLQVLPSYIHDLRLYPPGAAEQRSGLGLSLSERSNAHINPTVELLLQPRMRVYLRMVSAATRLTQLSLMSAEALRQSQQQDAQVQGLFLGGTLLMLIITLVNWVWTRDPIYRSYLGFLASLFCFFSLANGYMSTYVLGEWPQLAGKMLIFTACWVVASMLFFALRILRIDAYQPRIARALRWLGWLVLASAALAVRGDWVPRLVEIIGAIHLLAGTLLLAISAWQAWVLRSRESVILFISYLIFTLFEKIPILAMLELMPVGAWIFDISKVGFAAQLLLMHLLLVNKLRQEQLRKAQVAFLAAADVQAAQAQRIELNRFLGMLGHEIRTPLSVIDSAVQSLELQPGAQEPDRLSRHKRIRQAVSRLDRLVGEAMQRERIESSGWQLSLASLSVQELLRSTLDSKGLELPLMPLPGPLTLPLTIAGQSGGWLLLDLPAEPLRFSGDPHLLEIALGNLLDNACKYADPQSTVELRAERRAPSERGARPVLHIEVLSTGAALDDRELARVFDKYWRRDELHDVGGTGLGLHLVRHILHLHGGRVDARSLPGGQTSFSLQIPLLAV